MEKMCSNVYCPLLAVSKVTCPVVKLDAIDVDFASRKNYFNYKMRRVCLKEDDWSVVTSG